MGKQVDSYFDLYRKANSVAFFFVSSLPFFNFFIYIYIIQSKANLGRGGFETDTPPVLSAEAWTDLLGLPPLLIRNSYPNSS